MENRIKAHEKSSIVAKSYMDVIESLVKKGYNTIPKLEKKTGIPKSTISGRLSDLEREGRLTKTAVPNKVDSVYIEVSKGQQSRMAKKYAKMRVNCMLKTLKTEYFDALPNEIKEYFNNENN